MAGQSCPALGRWRHPWTAEDGAAIAADYPTGDLAALASRLGRTRAALELRAQALGVRRVVCGHRGLFDANTPTAFKAAPIGTERVQRGFVMRKVANEVDPNDPKRRPLASNWRPAHILNWIEANGPIPHRHLLLFRDGNRLNTAVENLELISPEEDMRRKHVGRYSPELISVFRTFAKLKRRIADREK